MYLKAIGCSPTTPGQNKKMKRNCRLILSDHTCSCCCVDVVDHVGCRRRLRWWVLWTFCSARRQEVSQVGLVTLRNFGVPVLITHTAEVTLPFHLFISQTAILLSKTRWRLVIRWGALRKLLYPSTLYVIENIFGCGYKYLWPLIVLAG